MSQRMKAGKYIDKKILPEYFRAVQTEFMPEMQKK